MSLRSLNRERDFEIETSGLGLQYTPLISCSGDLVLYIHSDISDTLSGEYFTGLQQEDMCGRLLVWPGE